MMVEEVCLQGSVIMNHFQVSGIDIGIEKKENDGDVVVMKVNCLCWQL